MEHRTGTIAHRIPHLPAPRGSEHDDDRAATIPTAITLWATLVKLQDSAGPGPYKLRDIAAAAQLPVQTTYRLLTAAVSTGTVTHPERGRYQLASSDAGPLEESVEQQPLLSALQADARCPALLFAMTQLPGVTRRFLVAQDLGRDAEDLRRSPRQQQGALKLAPLNSDPAGLVIAAYRMDSDLLPPELQRIRQSGIANGPSALSGWTLIAAPVFRGGEATGSVALLLPDTEMGRPRLRARRTALLMDTAAALSGRDGRSQQAHSYRRAS